MEKLDKALSHLKLIFKNRFAEMLFKCWLQRSSSAIQLECVCGLVYYRAQTDHRAERGQCLVGRGGRGDGEPFCTRDFAMRVGGTTLGGASAPISITATMTAPLHLLIISSSFQVWLPFKGPTVPQIFKGLSTVKFFSQLASRLKIYHWKHLWER